MSEKLINLAKRLSVVAKVSEQEIIYNIEKSISLRIATEDEIEKIINKIID